jgi:hypothetical protein
MQYPHWLMVAGAILVVVGFIGFALHKNKAEPAETAQAEAGRMTSDDDEADKAVRSWIDSEPVDSVADYAERGRKYAALSDVELSSAWVQTIRASARDTHNKEQRTAQADYSAEFSLRGIDPPFNLVHDDMVQMTENIKIWMASLSEEDLDALTDRVEKHFQRVSRHARQRKKLS